jgi:HEPN domain-containing protein
MKPESIHEAKRWFEQALRDIDDAKFAHEGKRYNLVCFLAQQAAEKAVKAYLYAQGVEMAWGHSVIELCADAESFDKSFSSLRKAAGALDKYYIPTRYPNGLPGGIPADVYQEDDALKAINMAEETIEVVRKKTNF